MNRLPAGIAAGSLIATVAVVLAGCSSSATSGHGLVAATSAPPTSASASSASTSSAPSMSLPVSRPAVPTPPASSAVGDAPGLTASGATLQVGRQARVRYELDSASKQSSVLAIGVMKVRRGSIADLSGFDLDAQSKTGVPFYVTATFKNVGKKTVTPSGIFGTINAVNGAGDKVTSLQLIGDFPKCDGLPPDRLAPGKSFTQCQVYVAPAGQRVAKVVYDHFVQLDETKITWSV